MLQRQQWRWILPGLGLTGFAVCAHTFNVRINLYAQDRTIAIGVLTANKNELAARAFEGASVLALVLWSWALVAERALRRAAALVGRWRRRRCCQLAKRTGAGVSWLCAVEAP